MFSLNNKNISVMAEWLSFILLIVFIYLFAFNYSVEALTSSLLLFWILNHFLPQLWQL